MQDALPNSKRDSKRGAALLESAIVLLVFVSVLIGILDVSHIFFMHQTIVWRVQAAARWAAVNPFDETSIRNTVLYGQPTPPQGAATAISGLSASMVTAAVLGADSEDARIVVKVAGYWIQTCTPLLSGGFQVRTIAASAPVEN